MTDKDQLERLKWQVTQETGLRAQMTERMEKAEKAAGVLRHDLRAALDDIKALLSSNSDARDALRAKSKQQLADSLRSENATRDALKETERDLAEARDMNRAVIAKCNRLQKSREEALAPLRLDAINLRVENERLKREASVLATKLAENGP